MLLVVPYNSVYYNYITIIQWLVGSRIKAKRVFALAKKWGGGREGEIDLFLKVVIFPSQMYAYLKHS